MNSLQNKLISYVNANTDKIYRFLAKLIGFDTTNFIKKGNEFECQKYIYNEYTKLGAQVELYTTESITDIENHSDFEKGRDSRRRPNVTVCLPCAEKYRSIAKSLMISSHIDTMPAGDLTEWNTNPFQLVKKDGKAFGLGISDNKYGAAISYAIYNALKNSGLKLKNNLYLTMVSDEEYFGGNGSLLACLKYPCDLYINLDGCDYEPQIAGLGGTCFELNIKCQFQTSSAEPVVDALYYARKELETFGKRRFDELETNQLYRGSEHAKSAYRLMEFGSGTLGTNVDLGKLRIVVYTTLNRELLKNELDSLYQKNIKPYFDRNNISSKGFEQVVRCMEYIETKNTYYAYQLRDYMKNLSGKEVKIRGACLSDLDIYLRNGSPDSFNVGLIREFKLEGGAHKPNEFIYCSEFENLTKALLLFVLDWYQPEEI